MIKTLLSTVLIVPMLVSTASADTGFGIGFGSLYNGLGLNLSKSNGTSLSFAALGCVGWSTSSGTSQGSDGSINQSSSSDSICGIGFGYVSTTVFPGHRQGLSLSLGLNYDTGTNVDGEEGTEWSLTPSYHIFLNGIGQRGLNLGFGPRLTFRDGDSMDPSLMLNLGYQF